MGLPNYLDGVSIMYSFYIIVMTPIEILHFCAIAITESPSGRSKQTTFRKIRLSSLIMSENWTDLLNYQIFRGLIFITCLGKC